MNDKNGRKTNTENLGNQSLESLHRTLFNYPDDKNWEATRSLAQPSFLKQIDSCGGAHSTPVRIFSGSSRKQ